MSHETLYKYKVEGGMELEIRAYANRPFTQADFDAARKAGDKLQEELERETLRLDPDAALERELERQHLLALFLGRDIFVDEIANGYAPDIPYYSHRPWFLVTTKKGRITLGWRKRVIAIKWEPSVGEKAEVLFPDEPVTKIDHSIHAWGYDKARGYIQKLLS